MTSGGTRSQYRTRSSLIQRISDPKDQEGWQRFHDFYSRLIFSVARKAGLTATEAEEVQQETFITLARNIHKYDRNLGGFRTFLLCTTRWRILDQFKRRDPRLKPLKERPTVTDGTAPINRIADPAGVELDLLWNQEFEQNLLATALNRVKSLVSAKQFQIFDLYVLKNWPAEKVADFMGIKIGAVYLAKCRVQQLVKTELKDLASAA